MLRAGFGKDVFLGSHVAAPQLALLVIALTDLPVACGIIEPLFEPFQLLFLADGEKKLDYVRPGLPIEQLFEIINLFESFCSPVFRGQMMDPHRQHVGHRELQASRLRPERRNPKTPSRQASFGALTIIKGEPAVRDRAATGGVWVMLRDHKTPCRRPVLRHRRRHLV